MLRCYSQFRDLDGATFLGMRMTDFPQDILRYWLARLSVLVLLQCFCLGESAQFDGPAELPRVYVRSALSDTPVPGKQVAVREGDDLQFLCQGLDQAAFFITGIIDGQHQAKEQGRYENDHRNKGRQFQNHGSMGRCRLRHLADI